MAPTPSGHTLLAMDTSAKCLKPSSSAFSWRSASTCAAAVEGRFQEGLITRQAPQYREHGFAPAWHAMKRNTTSQRTFSMMGVLSMSPELARVMDCLHGARLASTPMYQQDWQASQCVNERHCTGLAGLQQTCLQLDVWGTHSSVCKTWAGGAGPHRYISSRSARFLAWVMTGK